ncbi:hypothetical protein [Enterococcus sp. LJL51]|uniref:hypothetical protein n=1 Tax=Enterococcus sp. LJL51 TaxID=3416656 RepID=UPI003CEEF677
MKASTKITVGLSIAAVAGVVVAVTASEKIIKKIGHVSNRCKAKKIVQEKLGGNDKIMSMVDHLSDEDLDAVLSVLDKVKEGREKASDYGDKVKENAEGMKDKILSFIEELL